MTAIHDLFASSPRGVETLLARELEALGGTDLREKRCGVVFRGSLEVAYRACLWSRLANRVLLPLCRFEVKSSDDLYEAVLSVPWQEHLATGGTLAVDVSASGDLVRHSHYAMQRVKDAVVDQFRSRTGRRPSVDVREPDVRIHVRIDRDEAVLSVDLSGASLHRRSYRTRDVPAPLKENLAAAILMRAGWQKVASEGGALVDPMCGSGTLPIEAALIAGDIAPGLLRSYFGFLKWRGHNPKVWRDLRREAEARRDQGIHKLPRIAGYDIDEQAVRAAERNVAQAGLVGRVHLERRDVAECRPSSSATVAGGLVVVNPPYGERLGAGANLEAIYATLGDALKRRFPGWRAFVLTQGEELPISLGLRATRRTQLYNGKIPCVLLEIPIFESTGVPKAKQGVDDQAGSEMLRNRLKKNLARIGRWAKKEGVTCYRIYDADLPEYAAALDRYGQWLHVQEYAAPSKIPRAVAERRLREIIEVAPEVLGVAPNDVFVKVRRRQRGRAQYEKLDNREQLHEVHEGGLRFLVNLTDRLDTGLYLDHRNTRALIAELAKDQRFLNLFGYTATATVYAAAAGARSSTTVDMSNTYLDWARRNFTLNGISGPEHALVRADCMAWLKEQPDCRYGLIFADVPTFSNSKKMEAALDIQRDHVELIQGAARLLLPGGTLLFANHHRRFKLNAQALTSLDVEEITERTLPFDFRRKRPAHRCYRIRKPR